MSTKRGGAGFTLVEVLVALALVGMALGATASVFANGRLGHETAAGAETALALAEERLAMAAVALRPGTSSGEFAGRFAWKTTVAADDDRADAAADAKALPRLYRVAAQVAWRDGRRSRELSLSTLRLGASP